MGLARKLAGRITAMRYDDLPEEAIRWSKIGILDTVGVALAGSREDGLEARMLEGSEEEERLEIKLDHALRVQEEELRRGKVDPLFAKHIEDLQKQVAKIRRYGAPA